MEKGSVCCRGTTGFAHSYAQLPRLPYGSFSVIGTPEELFPEDDKDDDDTYELTTEYEEEEEKEEKEEIDKKRKKN